MGVWSVDHSGPSLSFSELLAQIHHPCQFSPSTIWSWGKNSGGPVWQKPPLHTELLIFSVSSSLPTVESSFSLMLPLWLPFALPAIPCPFMCPFDLKFSPL